MTFEELMNDESFNAKLSEAQDLKEVVSLLAEYGIETTEEQLKAALPKEGELEETELENVAGGSFIGWVAYRIGYTIGRSIRGGGHGSFGGGGKAGGR